ncbi:hypothetical protein JA9_001945 [Meyerozyma sp. JA9]|nr:hypothetical protein JA9_001945 [Meyerozyma sp. JA9]
MIAQGIELAVLVAFMGAASYGVGSLPFRMNPDHSYLNKISRFSVGILTSTCLMIAIPEGIEILYDAAHVNFYDQSLSLMVGFLLFSGFFFMFLVDNLETIFKLCNRPPLETNQFDESDTSNIARSLLSIFKSTLSLGLLIHAAVDGIALGSAFNEDSRSLQLIFFFVIIVHKVPTAFSLPTLLLNEGVPAIVAKTHLFFFSLMTPFTSLLTYVLLSSVKGKQDYIVSGLVIFSGGSFLYVVSQFSAKAHGSSNDLPQIGQESNSSNETSTNFLWTIFGMSIPLLIAPFNY